jgi:hypothetical protein
MTFDPTLSHPNTGLELVTLDHVYKILDYQMWAQRSAIIRYVSQPSRLIQRQFLDALDFKYNRLPAIFPDMSRVFISPFR